MLETILSVLAAAGFTGVTMAVVLKHFLEKSIEKAISHRYDKLLETHKVENLLLSKRYDSSGRISRVCPTARVAITRPVEHTSPTTSESQ